MVAVVALPPLTMPLAMVAVVACGNSGSTATTDNATGNGSSGSMW